MADGIVLNAGSGGSTLATDDAGVSGHVQIVKLALSADASASPILADAKGLEVQQATAADLNVTEASAAAIKTAVELIDDAVVTDGGSASTKGVQIAGHDGTNPQLVSVTAGGLVHIHDAGGSLTVDNGGTFAVQVDNTVTVASHAVTNAGTFAVQVDGNALTALQLIDNPVVVDDAAFTPATTSVMMAGFQFDDVAPDSVNEGDAGAARMSANRNLYTTIRDAAGNERGVNVNASNQLSVSVDNTVTVGSHAVTNAGTFAVQVDGSALTALQVIDNPVLVDDAAFTPATSSVMMAGFEADETATDSVDEGDAGAARMTLDRKQIVTVQPHSAGGLSIFRSLDLDESEEEVSATACTVYAIWATNTATTTRWLKLYNLTAANTTVGTSTPLITIGIPGNTSDDVAAHLAAGGCGITFGTALSAAVTTGVADNDTGAPAANDFIVNIFYKN